MAGDAAEHYVPPEDRHSGPFEPHEIESAADTLHRSNKIMANKALHRAVKKHAAKKAAAMRAIAESGPAGGGANDNDADDM
jgi:hypothetical protein